MRQWLPLVVIVSVFVALGVTNLPGWRGNTQAEAQRIQTKLDAFPKELGSWTSEPAPITAKVLAHAEAQAHLSRFYLKDGAEKLNVLVLVGPPQAMGAHTPEVCYEGLGYVRAGRVEKLPLPGEAGSELWNTIFEKPNSSDPALHVTWGHGVGGKWIASDAPRFEFANESLVFKVYVSRNRPLNTTSANETPDPLPEFLELFFKEFRATFPAK